MAHAAQRTASSGSGAAQAVQSVKSILVFSAFDRALLFDLGRQATKGARRSTGGLQRVDWTYTQPWMIYAVRGPRHSRLRLHAKATDGFCG